MKSKDKLMLISAICYGISALACIANIIFIAVTGSVNFISTLVATITLAGGVSCWIIDYILDKKSKQMKGGKND